MLNFISRVFKEKNIFLKAGIYVLYLIHFFNSPCVAQVNLQTGSAVFSLPMFNWQDDKSRLTSVVALSYNSGNGLKVNDVASNVGQGWNLIAGGVISRMQVGEPDDQIAYNGTTQYYKSSQNDQDVTKYPAGYLYAGIAASSGCPNALANYPTYGAQNVLYKQHNLVAADRQLDYFSFQFNGKSGQFVLDTAGGDHGVMIGASSIKITFQRDPTMTSQGIRTTITSFTIQDVDGLIYKFTRHGLTKVLNVLNSNGDGTIPYAQSTIKNNGIYCQSAFDQGPTASPWVNQYVANPFIISSWYLSEIDDPLVSRKILFTYNSLNLSNSAGSDISYNQGPDNFIFISYKKSVSTALEISSITYPDGHLINFSYSSAARFDFAGEFPLSSVNISYQGRYLSQYQLNQNYFILNRYGTPTTSYQKSVARLCLRSVKKIGVDLKEDTPPYIFDYYTSTGSNNSDDIVPPPFSYVKDIWGYYNGNNSIVYNSSLTGSIVSVNPNAANPYGLDINSLKGLCFLNQNVTGTYYNAKPGYAENGLLKTIIYPTGGSLVYQYAQNTGTFMGQSTVMNIGGVHVSQTSSYDGGYSNGCTTPVTTQYNYVVNGTGSASSLWGVEQPVNSLASTNNYKEEKMTIHFSLSNPLGTCYWHFVYPGILSQNEAVSLDNFQKIMNAMAPVLGVLSVISDVMDVIKFSWGSPLAIVAVVLDVISAVLTYVLSCPRITKTTLATTFYNFDLNSSSPLPAQFKRVEITESPGTIGKTVEQFTNGDPSDPNMDYGLWDQPGNNHAFSIKQRFAPWAYGLPKLITQYDVNGNKIKETQNVYDFTYAQWAIADLTSGGCGLKNGQYTDIYSCKCLVFNNWSQRGDNWTNSNNVPGAYTTGNTSNMLVDIYNINSGIVNLITTYERVYRTTDATQFVQTETDYTYNRGDNCSVRGNFDVNQIKTIQSNGDVNYKNIKYTVDYNTGPLATLVQNNMVSIPVATNTYVFKSGNSTQQYLSEKVTEFTSLSNNDVKPSRIIEQRFAVPVTSFTAYSGPTTTNYANYKIPQQFTYDVYANLIGLKDEGGRVVTNRYDYNDKYIVASVINADPSIDVTAYTSFESQDLSRSGWVLSGTASYLANSLSPTGGNVFTLQASGANTLTVSPLNSPKPYTLSFWANGSGVSVSGSPTLIKSAPTYSGFTYYEYSIPAGTSSVVIKSGSTSAINIDELRLYPTVARMRTTTYDPLVGKTSECDENNRITYYTYDNLGRMRFIEDESRNVLKMYEYNNVSAAKQIACPGSFTNHLVSEIFTRSNCGTGYQGSSVTYTIPASRYSSTSSQWDADIQAEIDVLTNGQNYANTNGTCSLLYYNTFQSVTDTTQSCDPGYAGGPVVYSVAAGTYSSIDSQADANRQALIDISANAMAYANSPLHANCTISTTPDWEWFPGDTTTTPIQPADSSYCLSVNGALPPHLFVQATDQNPNSPTYSQKQWEDYGPNSLCAANTYFNATQSVIFTRNNCSTGYIGTSVTYTVPPGKYSSTANQAAANQLATNDVNANGQNYANSNGSCLPNENINYNDSRTFQYSVRFTNNSTGAIYNFTANANTSGTLGQVPSGVYTVYICPINNYTANNNYTVQGITQTSVVCATFNNVSVTSTASLSLY